MPEQLEKLSPYEAKQTLTVQHVELVGGVFPVVKESVTERTLNLKDLAKVKADATQDIVYVNRDYDIDVAAATKRRDERLAVDSILIAESDRLTSELTKIGLKEEVEV